VKYACIKKHCNEFPIKLMCALLAVCRSAYYDWLQRQPTAGEIEDRRLMELIEMAFAKGRGTYGTRRIKQELAQQGVRISRRRIGRLLTELCLACKVKRKFKATTNSKHDLPITENILQREFTVAQPNQVYVGDITYIHTLEGWLYLAVVIDLYSRQVVGWSMAERMQATLVNDALAMAIWQRKPARGLISHSDRGSQYASDSHRQLLTDHGIVQSMSRKGDCWDNAVAESFFHSLKTELVHHETYPTRAAAKQSVFEYIEVFYNRQRLHSSNGYLSPVDFELQRKAA
jgi:putative transposase